MSSDRVWLEEYEHRWRPLLRTVSLVGEIDVPEQDVRAVLTGLGRLYRSLGSWRASRMFTNELAACTAMSMAQTAAIAYDQGAYWPALCNGAGVSNSQATHEAWGGAFSASLDKLGLARFDLPLRHVSEIVVHACVPDSCLRDLLNLLIQRRGRTPHLTAAEFVDWALAPGRASRLFPLDVPVRRFITYGGEYALDFVDRCLDLLDLLPHVDVEAEVGLPGRTVRQARRLWQEGELWQEAEMDPAHPARRVGPASGIERPQLMLQPFGDGVVLWLPPVGDAPDGRATWSVRLDGELQRIASRSMRPGALETAPATTVPLGRPVREIVVELSDSGHEYPLNAVDPGEPLIVFSDEGRRIAPSADLPRGKVWLLYVAGDADGRDLQVEGDLEELDDVPPPFGWEGWTVRCVDLRNVGRIRIGETRWRTVSGRRRPELSYVPALAGVRSVYGTPVLAEPPALALPGEPGVPTEWRIRVRRPEAESLSAATLVVEEDQRVDPWRDLPRPLVGPYELTVRGPLGRGLSRVVEIVEGLGVVADPRWRRMGIGGLDRGTVRPHSARSNLRFEPEVVRLGPDEPEAEFRVDGGGVSEHLVVSPPHMAVQVLQHEGRDFQPGRRGRWSFRPLWLDAETITHVELQVSLPAEVPAQLVVTAGDKEQQVVDATGAGRGAVARFALGKIADTVTEHGAAELHVRLEGVDIPVARCRPRRLAAALELDGEHRLVLVNGSWASGLSAGVYRLYAPWAGPEVLEIGRDLRSAPLPSRFRRAGPLLVHLRIEDPWLAMDWPAWPPSENTFTLRNLPLSIQDMTDPEAEVACFLAGVLGPPDLPQTAPLVIGLYGRAADLRDAGVSVDVRSGVAAALGKHPAETLAALLDSTAPSSELVAPLAQAGLVYHRPVPLVTADQECQLWAMSPVAGMIASAHRLRAGDPQLQEQVAAVCGETSVRILAGDPDPHPRAGRFDVVAERLAVVSPEQQDMVWRAARIVPGGILDGDARAVAARKLFDNRQDRKLLALTGQMAQLRELLADAPQVVHRALHARRPDSDEYHWLHLPVVSLALAFCMRLAARDRLPLAAAPVTLASRYVRFARSAPELATIDLVLAELLLTGEGHR